MGDYLKNIVFEIAMATKKSFPTCTKKNIAEKIVKDSRLIELYKKHNIAMPKVSTLQTQFSRGELFEKSEKKIDATLKFELIIPDHIKINCN